MIDSNQDSPTETISPQKEETTLPDGPDVRRDHSSETAEFQGQPLGTLAARLQQRAAAVDGMMKTKEELILEYVSNKLPIPFYLNWKRELNDIFSLRVRLKRRSEELMKRDDTKKAE